MFEITRLKASSQTGAHTVAHVAGNMRLRYYRDRAMKRRHLLTRHKGFSLEKLFIKERNKLHSHGIIHLSTGRTWSLRVGSLPAAH